jgi:excisionase family DNA binding protein
LRAEFCGGLYAHLYYSSGAKKNRGKKHSRAEKHGGENMLSVEIRFVMQGKEVSVDSFIETIVPGVRAAVREEISRTPSKQESQTYEPSQGTVNESPRQAVSIREAARLLSISPRTIHGYIASNAIRTVRVGRRVLVPMKSVNEVASRGIPWRRNQKSTG